MWQCTDYLHTIVRFQDHLLLLVVYEKRGIKCNPRSRALSRGRGLVVVIVRGYG